MSRVCGAILCSEQWRCPEVSKAKLKSIFKNPSPRTQERVKDCLSTEGRAPSFALESRHALPDFDSSGKFYSQFAGDGTIA